MGAPSPQKLVGNLQWRIKDPVAQTSFVTRYTVQEFEMDKTRQGILYNHEDDWYVLAAKDQKYVVVYYRGNNDAWDGYGGAVVYTKEPAFPKEFIPEMREAVEKVGLKWDDFVLTDNTCKARESKLEEFEQDLVFVEGRAAASLQLQGNRVVKEIAKDVVAIEREVVKDVSAIEKEIEKDVVGLEQEVEKDVKGLFGFGKK